VQGRSPLGMTRPIGQRQSNGSYTL
jgi:hypothetical protein